MNIRNDDVYWCEGCRLEFPLKLLKRCGACRISKYCSPECQKSEWKDRHELMCREIQKNLLKEWSGSWDGFFRWIAVRAFDLTNKPGNHRNRCLELDLKMTGSDDVRYAYEVLGGRIQTLNVAEVVRFQPYSDMSEEDPCDQLYIALLVRGKDDDIVDALGLAWGLPYSIYDTPERSEIWAEHCVDAAKFITVHSKPRHAIRDATLTMETLFLMLGKRYLPLVDHLRGRE